MKKNKLEIIGLKELNFEQKQYISGGGSEYTDLSWDMIGKGFHYAYNGIRDTLKFFTNGNSPEHTW